MNEKAKVAKPIHPFSRGGLRAKIIAWSFVPTALVLLAVALVTFFAFQNATEELVIEQTAERTYVAANQLAAKLRQFEDLLSSVARSSDVYSNNPATQRAALKRDGNRLAVFDGGVLLLDGFGAVVAAEPERPELLGQDWSDRGYFQEVVRSQIVDSSAGLVVSDIVQDGPKGTDVVVLALPVIGEQDRFQGVLLGMFRINPAATNALYAEIVRLRVGESGSTYLVDKAGRVVYHSDADHITDDFVMQTVVQQVLDKQTDAVRTSDLNGKDVATGFAPVPDTSWGLVTEEAWSNLTAGFRSYRNFLLFLFVLGVVTPAIVVGVGVRRITRPITDLISAAQEVAQGKFGQTITANTGDEIEELAGQFNVMSAQLQESYANLEQNVADRTRELATLNAVAAVVSRSLDLDEILSDALDETMTLLDVKAGAILLLEPGGAYLETQTSRGLADSFLEAVKRVPVGEGISGQAVVQRKPIVLDVDDYARADFSQHTAPSVLNEGIRTLASTPLVHLGQVHGVMNLATRRPRAFPPEELDMLTAIGQQIGVAIENARLYEQSQQELIERNRTEEELRRVNDERARRNRELLLLNRVIAATTSRLEPDAVLEAVCRELALAFDVPEVGAALLDEGGATLTVVAEYRTEERPSALGAVMPIVGYPSAEYVLEHKAPLAVADAQHDPRMAPVHDLMRQRNAASLLIVPLLARGEVVGTIGLVAVEPREFNDEEIALAGNAAAAASQALENARAEDALRRSQQRLLLHVQHTPLAYIEWDADLRVVDWNPSAERIFGYSEQEARLKHAYEIIVPPAVQPHVTEIWQEILQQTGGTRSTNENVTKDGRTITCEWYNTPLIEKEGRVIGLASLVQDITERVQAEEDLREAKDAAEAANRAKSIFLANMSHELRTPLNAILGFAQLMTRDPDVTREQQESLEIIGRSGEHLLGLINDVLEMSKIEAGRVTLQIESFDLYRMLDGLEEMFQLRARDKGLVLVFDRDPDVPQFVRADEGKLRQVLMNLVGNAIKFTNSGGVTLRVGRSPPSPTAAWDEEDEGLRLRFEVKDTGPGITPEEMSAVFDPFVQTATGTQSQEGTGLGLPISRSFVRLMGGDFVVTSEQGLGSAFTFDAPMEPARADEVPLAHASRRVIGLEPGQPTYRILVAEDQETNRKLLVNVLTNLDLSSTGSLAASGGHPEQSERDRHGIEVREAADGQEAVEMWERWAPHMIWMDLRMPVMDGFEATKRIRALQQRDVERSSQRQATVIVALTASAFEKDRSTILAAGCDDFLRKPFREEEIFGMLAKHLGVRFVYEDEFTEVEGADRERMPKELSPKDLAGLPRDWVTKLRQAATQLDADVVLELLDDIRRRDALLADGLAFLVRSYRFDVILALTEPVENENEKSVE